MLSVSSSELTFASTVPRSLVHRSAVCEVFLTDITAAGPGRFRVAAQLPRVHSFYSDSTVLPASYDPILLMEVVRQCAILVAHNHFDAAPSAKFVLNSSVLEVVETAALHIGANPGQAVLAVTLTDVKQRTEVTVGISLDISLAIDGRSAVTAQISIQWMPETAWNELRRRGRAQLSLAADRSYSTVARLPPADVGRYSSSNVVLAGLERIEDGVLAHVLVDQTHPALFDHPLDHVPGMLVVEAIRQAAIVAVHDVLGLSALQLLPVRCDVAFTRFGEFELPTECQVRVRDQGPAIDASTAVSVTAEVVQDDVIIACGALDLQPLHRVWTRQSSVAGGVGGG